VKTSNTVTFRAATRSDAGEVQAKLAEAIATSPFYGERFKAVETQRYSARYLHNLMAVDPWHVAVAEQDGEIVAVVITIPEFGNLMCTWFYVDPRFQSRALGIKLLRFMIRFWDHKQFHKVSCYVRPQNHAALVIFQRFGFQTIATLKNHVFGEDYVLLERPFEKTIPDYDHGVPGGPWAFLKSQLARVLPVAG
jgi:ribosomal protein S18 acetylase RimI-like enzyme